MIERVDMVNERTGRRINVPNVPDAIERNRQLGYEIDTDPPIRFFRTPLPWRFDPEMPRVPRVATRFKGGRRDS